MKITFSLFLTLALISNYSYSATYSAYIPLEGKTSTSELPEVILPPISEDFIIDLWSGQSSSGMHPYINSINVTFGDNVIIYNINSKTKLNFKITNNVIYGSELLVTLNTQGCNRNGSNYNCQFTFVPNPLVGLDQGGRFINELLENYPEITQLYDSDFIQINVSN